MTRSQPSHSILAGIIFNSTRKQLVEIHEHANLCKFGYTSWSMDSYNRWVQGGNGRSLAHWLQSSTGELETFAFILSHLKHAHFICSPYIASNYQLQNINCWLIYGHCSFALCLKLTTRLTRWWRSRSCRLIPTHFFCWIPTVVVS